MRASFAGLNTMVRGIMANQLSLDTTGHNITNAGTEGYSRQVVTLATTYAEQRPSLHGTVIVGTGVDALAVNRARDVYADIQYRNENPTQQYYKTLSVNYDKLETIFDDSKNLGIEESINKFYQTWVDLSTMASNSASRTQVIEQGRELSDRIQAATADLQEQIRSEYKDIEAELKKIDDILEEISVFNNQILSQEVTGAQANDLRDRRDLLVDELSNYLNITITENSSSGGYQINSGGVTLVNGSTRSHLIMSDGVSSSVYGVDYGVTDYNIKVKESNIVFLPQNGSLKARFDAIAENKEYIDKMANIASFFLSTFNDQHKQGWDLDGDYKFVDSDGKEVDASTVSDNMVEYVDADGTCLLASDVGMSGTDYYNKNITLTEEETEEGKKIYYNGADEVDADNVVQVGDTYYLRATNVPTDTKYWDNNGNAVSKVSDTINFYGQTGFSYQYRYDPITQSNYLYRYETSNSDSGDLLSGVQIINAMEVNVKFNENRGDRYLAAATSKQYIETTAGKGSWQDMAWSNRTGDGTNAVYMSELFNISMETVISDNRANAEVYRNSLLRDKAGNLIDTDGNSVTSGILATAMSKLSINAYYEQSMSNLGINAYSVDVNYEAMQNVIVQIQNWRDSTAGVDWNEELTNMIKFQKGFSSCSRCLTAMDEMLDRLVNSTGVVGR